MNEPELTVGAPLVVVSSDFVCPWCYIGEHRLRQAVQAAQVEAKVQWVPFQLNPWIPDGGMPRREYRIRKFGSWERSLEMDAHVAMVAEAEGLPIDYSRMARTPNTFDLHRLMHLAGILGDPDRLARQLFAAYFVAGVDLNDLDAVLEIGVRSGLPCEQVEAVLRDRSQFSEAVRTAEIEGRTHGVHGVPRFRVGDRVFEGAVSPSVLVDALVSAGRPRKSLG